MSQKPMPVSSTNASIICHCIRGIYIFFMRVNKINFHFFRLHGATFCNVHSEVGYELVLGTTWFGYELVVGTSWSGYELVLGTSWLGYELAWYDLLRVRVDWKPLEDTQRQEFLTIMRLQSRKRSLFLEVEADALHRMPLTCC